MRLPHHDRNATLEPCECASASTLPALRQAQALKEAGRRIGSGPHWSSSANRGEVELDQRPHLLTDLSLPAVDGVTANLRETKPQHFTRKPVEFGLVEVGAVGIWAVGIWAVEVGAVGIWAVEVGAVGIWAVEVGAVDVKPRH